MFRCLIAVLVVSLAMTAAAFGQPAQPSGKLPHAIPFQRVISADPPPLQFSGVVEDAVRVPDAATATARMKMVADAGFNAIKITMPWSKNQAEIINDHQRACNAAVAARENGLDFVLDIIPNGVFFPVRSSPISRFQKTLNDYLNWISGENGCVAGMPLTVEIGNEPNTKRFLQLNREGTGAAALAYTRLLARSYASVKQKASELGIQVTVWGGALASSHDPLGFITAMGEAKNQLGLKGPMMDAFSYHPYGQNSAEPPDAQHLPGDGTVIGVSDYNLLVAALEDAFGYLPPVVYSEYGVETTGQNGVSGAGKPVTPTVQGSFYRQALNLAVCQGVKSFFIFHLFDDPEPDDWQSGMYYRDDATPKVSLPVVRQAVIDARTPGAMTCG